MDRFTPIQQRILISLLLVAATLATFWPVTTHQFISYDDAIYITGNSQVQQGLTAVGVGWAFHTGHGGNWHPVTWLSHMADVQLFGTQPGWHHLISAILHALNAALLFLLLEGLTKSIRRSAVVAALFAFHPLHVQSVAWAAERKDVLSALFFLLTLLAYARYALPTEAGNKKSPLYYAFALIFFALGLMSKPMLVTVPFVLLLLDYWPLRRVSSSISGGAVRAIVPLLVEKIPFFLLAAISCGVTMWVQKKGGAVVTVEALSFGGRVANALSAYVDYLRQTFWPAGLALIYPLNELPPAGTLVLFTTILLAVTGWAVWNIRGRPHLSVGWFWYLGMLVPVIGLVQVGMQQRADRYTYLPLIGIFLLVVWEISERLGSNKNLRALLTPLAGVALIGCVVLTRDQIACWQDSEHIFARAAEVTSGNYVALNNYALALVSRGDVAGAVPIYEQAVALKPDLDAARVGLASALMQQGKFDEAAKHLNHVLALQPDNASAQLQLGLLLARTGKLPDAEAAMSRALAQSPSDSGIHNNYGNVLLLQGKYEAALKQFSEAVRLQPDYAIAYNNLGTCNAKLGRIAEAIESYHQSLRFQPNSPDALNKLAWLLATQPDAQFRDGTQAIELAVRAGEMTQYKNPAILMTLAAAFAETGRFAEAVSYAELAQQQPAAGQPPLALAEQLREMLYAFRAGKAYRSK